KTISLFSDNICLEKCRSHQGCGIFFIDSLTGWPENKLEFITILVPKYLGTTSTTCLAKCHSKNKSSRMNLNYKPEMLSRPDGFAPDNPAPGQLAAFFEGLRTARVGAAVTVDALQIREVLSIQIEQVLSGHHRLRMRFYQDQIQPTGTMLIDGAEKLLGKVAEVELYDINGVAAERLQNLFIVADVQFEHQALNEGIIHLTGYAPTWVLDGAPHFETCYKKNLDTIVKAVSRPLSQVKAKLQVKATLGDSLSYVCRYNESSWNFLKRLSSETGQWLYFNGESLIFGQPVAKVGATIVYGDNCSKLNMRMQARSVQERLLTMMLPGIVLCTRKPAATTEMRELITSWRIRSQPTLFGTSRSVAAPAFLPAESDTLETLGKHKGGQQVADMYYVQGESTG